MMKAKVTDGRIPELPLSNTTLQGHTGLPLSRQKKILEFSRQIAGNMSNKYTFINPNSP